MQQKELIPHLFRTEYRKIVAVLYRRFGFDHVETAEDIASDTFLVAAQTWALQGIPKNSVAWLYQVAKNNAKSHIRRQNLFNQKIVTELKKTVASLSEEEIDLSPQNITDSQLQMMFTICHPVISQEAQIGLSLRILCGFGIEEIADAFLTNKETISKRLQRAKEKLRDENVKIGMPGPAAIEERLDTVLRTIYLLFSEGYYSATQTIRKEFCVEAMRLCTMLVENESTNRPEVNALLSLMCFQASRLDARINHDGELVLYEEQDTILWNPELISKGAYFLKCAASGNKVSKYHLEATIAYWHTQKTDSNEKWENILHFYNQLLHLEYSPIAALNRTYALSKVKGKNTAITEAEKLKLEKNHFYHSLLGELYKDIDNTKAADHLNKALVLARSSTDKAVIVNRLEAINL